MKNKILTLELPRKNGCLLARHERSVGGQFFLFDDPLTKRPTTLADVTHMLLAHWGRPSGMISSEIPCCNSAVVATIAIPIRRITHATH